MKNKLNLLFIGAVACILLALPVGTLLSPKSDYSIFENRSLAEAPVLTRETLLDGRFFDGAETWYKDHVVLRNQMLEAATLFQKYVLHKPAVNDILPSQGSLLPVVAPKYAPCASEEEIDAAADELAALKAAADTYGGQVIYMGVPGQITMFADSYPDCLSDTPRYFRATGEKFAGALEQAGIAFIDGHDYLTQEMYFRVDHHFGVTGGYAVYEKLCGAAGVRAVPKDRFTFSCLPNPFYGSRNRKIYDLTSIKDALEVFAPDALVPFDRYDNGQKVESKTLNLPENEQAIVTEDYMGGDIAETVLQTHRPELPDLLIYGDSYTNAVECFAYLSFNETRALDLRHYEEMSLCDYVRRHRPDFIVCIRDDGNYTNLTGNGVTTRSYNP